MEEVHVGFVAPPGQALPARHEDEFHDLWERTAGGMLARNPFRIRDRQVRPGSGDGEVRMQQADARLTGVDEHARGGLRILSDGLSGETAIKEESQQAQGDSATLGVQARIVKELTPVVHRIPFSADGSGPRGCYPLGVVSG